MKIVLELKELKFREKIRLRFIRIVKKNLFRLRGETRAVVEDYGSWNDGWKNASVEDKEGRSERVDIVASRMNGLETV